ncbi:hypothetical protein NFHSH190041_12190 [Shewanella sp. NFH-SH190041]|uniref:motility associated factor glycosyltransferase family protein n=1 Tax=Shewanella sp. NFH-SH190041 TaxID=2950245 RepID=UPI0021C3D1BE|nr:6-hydroxymethylpterin diphosphokinase MptE-like protein [Shewanella sp. NFH-SH190041]BDM63767.1 hypothetical protein NFHSH190041_12190 [Shewanella sp. NFH-SH190041]
MSALLQQNLAVIAQRWPALATQLTATDIRHLAACMVQGHEQTISVNGLQLSSRHNRQAEAAMLCRHLPEFAPDVQIYGVGMGDVPLHLLSHHTAQLHVHLLDLPLFALLLHYTDQRQWLSHQRVLLHSAPQFHYPVDPWVALSADMALCGPAYARVRDLLLYELNRSHVNQLRQQRAGQYTARQEENLAQLQQDADISAMAQHYPCRSAIVIASGPSLEQDYPALARLSAQPRQQRPLLIAVDTAVKGLHQAGVMPDIVVTLDELITPQVIDAAQSQQQALVYFPRTQPAVIQQWQGPKFNAYTDLPRDTPLAAKLPKPRLFTSGSVLHPATHLAVRLGAKQITFCGADFGYPGNKAHAYWQPGVLCRAPSASRHCVTDGKGARLHSALNLRGYLRALEHFIAGQQHVSFFRSQLSGADILGSHYRPLSQVLVADNMQAPSVATP